MRLARRRWPAGAEYPVAPRCLASLEFQSSPEWATLKGDKARRFQVGPGPKSVQAEDHLGRLPPSRLSNWRGHSGAPERAGLWAGSLPGGLVRPGARLPELTRLARPEARGVR